MCANPSQHRFTVEVIDVDADPVLEARYGEWVPVLEGQGRRLCHYRLDRAAVAAYLSAIG